MTTLDGLGYFAASMVLATFCAKTMLSLRGLAIVSNFAFIGYAVSAHLWPILLLHSVMLPMNVLRFREALSAFRRAPGAPLVSGFEWRRAPAAGILPPAATAGAGNAALRRDRDWRRPGRHSDRLRPRPQRSRGRPHR